MFAFIRRRDSGGSSAGGSRGGVGCEGGERNPREEAGEVPGASVCTAGVDRGDGYHEASSEAVWGLNLKAGCGSKI